MRTQGEILARIEARKAADIFGFEWPYYLDSLPFDVARPYLKPDATPEDWPASKSIDDIRREAIDYLPFAWEDANACRGISANRSIMHFQAWLWLLGEDWGDALMDNYEFYGKPQLERITRFFGLDPAVWDDGIRSNTEY